MDSQWKWVSICETILQSHLFPNTSAMRISISGSTDVSVGRALADLSVSSTHGWLTTTYNSSSRGSSTPLWLSQAHAACVNKSEIF